MDVCIDDCWYKSSCFVCEGEKARNGEMARLVGSADQMGILVVKGVKGVMAVMAVPGKLWGTLACLKGLEGLEGGKKGPNRLKSTKRIKAFESGQFLRVLGVLGVNFPCESLRVPGWLGLNLALSGRLAGVGHSIKEGRDA